jgi:anti-anti-sigma regulatory factor
MNETSGAPRLIRVDGVLDASAAERLSRALLEATPDVEVAIDLSQVRAFDDFAVMVLGRALSGRGGRVTVRGLRQHHVRLLRYLGIGPESEPSAGLA